MIVKDESLIIEKCLESVRDIIDYWVISDTGSTDGTQDIIKNYFNKHNIPGELHNDKWVDFGYNRTLSLQRAFNKSDYILLIDADMEFICTDIKLFRDYILQENKDIYHITQENKSLSYHNIRLIKGNKKFIYKGVTHEYISAQFKKTTEGYLDKNLSYFLDKACGSSRIDKYSRDINLLIDGLKSEPNNQRYMFYLAQSYFDNKDYHNSMKWYTKRVDLGGWEEEVYYSLYRIAECLKYTSSEKENIIKAYLKAHNFRPSRLEALYSCIRYLNQNSIYYESEIIQLILKNKKIEYPKNDILFIYKDIYNYSYYDEASLYLYYSNYNKDSIDILEVLIKENKYPKADSDRIINNYSYIKKPILCFYLGYTYNYIESNKGCYGSELSTLKISRELSKYYNVHIFGSFFNLKEKDGITYHNTSELDEFSKKNKIEIMIVSRYIHYFLMFSAEKIANKTYLWLHDTTAIPHFDFKQLPNYGKNLFNNVIDKIDKVITLSDWHSDFVSEFNEIPTSKIHKIGHGIDLNDFKDTTKVKNSFIWSSYPDRGLFKFINFFPRIKEILPDATLTIFGGSEYFSEKGININDYCNSYIKYMGKVTNKELIENFCKTDYWLYPNNCNETYCITALEAQAAGCMCIYTDSSGLKDTLGYGQRGVPIKSVYNTDEYWNEILETIKYLDKNPEVKESYINISKSWTKSQTWDSKVKEWIDLFSLMIC